MLRDDDTDWSLRQQILQTHWTVFRSLPKQCKVQIEEKLLSAIMNLRPGRGRRHNCKHTHIRKPQLYLDIEAYFRWLSLQLWRRKDLKFQTEDCQSHIIDERTTSFPAPTETLRTMKRKRKFLNATDDNRKDVFEAQKPINRPRRQINQ